MENLFTVQEYQDVNIDDGTRVAQTATDEYSVFLFKDRHTNNTDMITVRWNGQSDLAPSSSTAYLQIFNRDSNLWETLDSDSTTGANTDFDLNGIQSVNLTNYYDASNWVAFRVYQEAK